MRHGVSPDACGDGPRRDDIRRCDVPNRVERCAFTLYKRARLVAMIMLMSTRDIVVIKPAFVRALFLNRLQVSLYVVKVFQANFRY